LKKCQYCESEIERHPEYANHVRWCKKNPNYEKTNNNKNISTGMTKGYNKRLGEFKEFEVKCFVCNRLFKVKEREKSFPKKKKYFCKGYCSHVRVLDQISKDKISAKVKNLWNDNNYRESVLLHKNTINFYTSKGECAIRNYFKWNFPRDRWTFGGILYYKNLSLVRDLYSNKLKVCIEYDGIWHFEDIKGQLEDKQNKDLALEEWCLDNNYRLIRIKEDVFLKDEEFWIQQLVKETYSGVAKIVKFY